MIAITRQRFSITALACLCSLALAIASGCSKPEDKTASTTSPSGAGNGSAAAGSNYKIAVIPKGTTHAYWKSVESGARAAGKDLGVEVVWKGPVKENDRGDQIAMVEQFVAQGINGIVLAPLDFDGLADPVLEAKKKGIPVVVIDSALRGTAGTDFDSFVATNNHAAGALGGEQLAKVMNNKGKVVLLRYMPGSASTEERESGFLEAIAKHPDMTVISKDQFSGATQAEAQTMAANMMNQLQQADGVFCPNESSTLGMLAALDQAKLAGKIKFVGFDATPELVDALKAKQLDALISQDPRKMGYLGVKTLVSALKKEKVDTVVDTGVAVITLENLQQPEIQKVLGE